MKGVCSIFGYGHTNFSDITEGVVLKPSSATDMELRMNYRFFFSDHALPQVLVEFLSITCGIKCLDLNNCTWVLCLFGLEFHSTSYLIFQKTLLAAYYHPQASDHMQVQISRVHILKS